jgi:E3 ubiquitin-protein ligase Mdm2
MHNALDCQEKLDSNVICFGDKRVDSTSLPSAFSSYSAKATPEFSATSIPSDSSHETVLLESTSEKKAGETLLCVICAVEPRNASIIHGRSGHQVCCITCAEKLKAARKKCPVCRRKIRYVIKNFL